MRGGRRKRGEPLALGELLTQAAPRDKAAPRLPVEPAVWESVVGIRIASRSRPHKLERGTLTVIVAGSAWAQELALLCEEITRGLRAKGAPVERIRFRTGTVRPLRDPRDRIQKRAPAPAPLPNDVALSLAALGDDELRRTIARAAATNLGWQKSRDQRKP